MIHHHILLWLPHNIDTMNGIAELSQNNNFSIYFKGLNFRKNSINLKTLWIEMSSSRRRCKYDPDAFCYICGEYMMKGLQSLLWSVRSLAIKTSLGHHIWHAKLVWEVYADGPKVNWSLTLLFQWYGGNQKITLMTATSF